jgi:hypothetical protein
MKYTTTIIALIATIISAVLCLPASSFARQFEIPTCGAVCFYLTCAYPTRLTTLEGNVPLCNKRNFRYVRASRLGMSLQHESE